MPFKSADVQGEYAKNKQLRKEDVTALRGWMEKQPHLPSVSELQLILFLQSCYYSVESAKSTIDTFFTVRTHCPEMFANRDPFLPSVALCLDIGLYARSPKTTKEGYRVLYSKLIDGDSDKYVVNDQLKNFDMTMMLWLMQEGTAEGLVIVTDMDLINFGHMTKLSMLTMKKFLFYLQEGMPVRLKGLHFINVVSFMDKILALMKPFMKKELLDMLHLHTDSVESLYKFVPQECLPKDFGGLADSVATAHENMKKMIGDNADYFKDEEKQVVDESKRPGKPKNVGDIFGVEGTFKKLDLD